MTRLSSTAVEPAPRNHREPRERPQLWDPDERDFNVILAPLLAAGDVGKGKGVLGAFVVGELYDDPPKCIGGRPKIVVFDVVGRCESGCSFSPMLPSNPLFKYLTRQSSLSAGGEEEQVKEEVQTADGTTEVVEHPGVNPRGYRVEVRMPLSWAFDRPALDHWQPGIVKPFVLAIDDLGPSDWVEMLGLSEDARAGYLHQKVLSLGVKEGWLATATPETLAAHAETLTGKRQGKRRSYTQKQMQTLGSLYERLGRDRMVLPKHPDWADDTSLPWLDMKATLEDVDTATVFTLDFTTSRSLAAHVMAVLLNRIILLKDKNNAQRVRNAVIILIPDISIVAAPSFLPTEDKFMRPVKERILWLFSKGTGNGIKMIGDLQDFADLDQRVVGKGTSLALFQMERDKIRDALKNMIVENKDDVLDPQYLGDLIRPGWFLWKAPNTSRVVKLSGAIPRWEYPRHAMGAMSDFTYVDLWRHSFPRSRRPDMWRDIAPLYTLVASVQQAAERSREEARLEEAEEGKQPESAADFGPMGNERVKAVLKAFEGKGKATLGARDVAALLGDTAPGTTEVKLSHAKRVLQKLKKKGFAHLNPYSDKGRSLWDLDLRRLRKAVEAGAQTRLPSAVILKEYSEAAKKVADLGNGALMAYADGKLDEAARLLAEMLGLATAHKDDEEVKGVMIGFMGSAEKLSAAPELAEILKSLRGAA